jgi:hypothetical protein
MTEKDILRTVYEYLSKNQDLLTILGLTGADGPTISKQILKTRQIGNQADRKPKLAIWEPRPVPLSSKVNAHTLNIDVIVPLESQRTQGLALTISNIIKCDKDLRKARIGTGLHYVTTRPDQQTAPGWYKAQVVFQYNFIEK